MLFPRGCMNSPHVDKWILLTERPRALNISILTLKCYSPLASSDCLKKSCLPAFHIIDAIDLFLNPRQQVRIAMLPDVSGVVGLSRVCELVLSLST